MRSARAAARGSCARMFGAIPFGRGDGAGIPFLEGWLVALAYAALVFSLAMLVLPEATQRLFDSLYLSSPEGSRVFGEAAVRYIKFVSAILGAVMSGWAAALLYALLGY